MALPKRRATTKKKGTGIPFVIHSIYENCVYPAWWGEWYKTLKIASIDPGITHFCLRIEERTGDTFKTLKLFKTDIGDRTKLKRKTVSNNMDQNTRLADGAEIIIPDDKCYSAFTEPMRVYPRMTQLLNSMKDELLSCDLIIVESQVKVNYKMTRLGQHIIGHLINLNIVNPRPFLLVEVDPKLKSRLASTKPDNVKKWSVEYARNLAEKVGDTAGLALLNMRGKTNDFADTLVQVEGFMRYVKN